MKREAQACLRAVRAEELPDEPASRAPTIVLAGHRWVIRFAERQSGNAPGSAPGLTVAPIAVARQQHAADRIGRWIGLAAAIALHGAALVFFLLADAPEPSGGGGQQLEAISVDIVLTRVIEARDSARTEIAPAAQGPVAPVEGDQAEAVEAVLDRPRETKPDQPERLMKSEAPNAEAVMAEEMKPTKAEPERPAATPTPEEKPRPAPAAEARSQGGVAALTVEGQSRASAPASASVGAVQRYAMQVRAALARNKPTGRGSQGTATITFRISPSGKVSFTRVATSSGNVTLDKAALAAVERTSFPPPPPLMTERQLTYAVPFSFK
jgi:TonB family protein